MVCFLCNMCVCVCVCVNYVMKDGKFDGERTKHVGDSCTAWGEEDT